MRNRLRALPVFTAAFLLMPAVAHAETLDPSVGPVDFVVGLLGLATAVVLLLVVLALRRVADGAAIAENIAFVMGGVICLAASVLFGWVARYLPSGFTSAQAHLGAELLVLASMVLLAVYFFRVRQAMLRYLAVFSGGELLAHAQEPATQAEEEARVG